MGVWENGSQASLRFVLFQVSCIVRVKLHGALAKTDLDYDHYLRHDFRIVSALVCIGLGLGARLVLAFSTRFVQVG